MQLSRFFLIAVLIVSAFSASAQTDASSVQALRTARAAYEQGRLQEIEAYLEEPLQKNRFSKSERIEAYRLLVLTYIYLEEPDKADDAMLKLLKTDHFFEPNEETDPAEFIDLYRKYRKDPIFAIGLRGSLLTSNVNVQNHYYVLANGKGTGTYTSNLRLVGGLAFEKSLLKDKILFAPEIMLSSRAFTYANSSIFSTDNQTQSSGVTVQIAQQLVQLNLIGNYLFKQKLAKGTFQPYVGGGLSTAYLLPNGSTFSEAELDVEPGFEDVSGAPLDNTLNYKTVNLSAILLAGVKFKVTELFVTADVRYYWGLHNVVNTENRYSQSGDNVEILYRYGYVNNDFSINQAAVSIGIIYPYFKPKKLTK